MLFQIYGDKAGYQLLGWLLVFLGLILTNEIARRTKKGGIFFFLALPGGTDGVLHRRGRGRCHGRRLGSE